MPSRTFIVATLLGVLALNAGPASACGHSSAELLESGAAAVLARCGSSYNTAMQRAHDKDWISAIAAVNAQIADPRRPQQADMLELLAYLLGKIGDHQGAIENYRKAITLEPMRFSAHKLLGLLYAKTGEIAGAESEFAVLRRLCVERCGELQELEAGIAKIRNDRSDGAE